MSLAAGSDLVLMKAQNDLVPQTFNMIKSYVEDGKISETELNAKLTRLFTMKMEYGLFDTEAQEETPTEVAADEAIGQLSITVAEKSLTMVKAAFGALPLSREEPFLLVEQVTTQRSHALQHAAMLFKAALAYNKQLAFCETGFALDAQDKERLSALVENYDTVVMTCFYDRADASPAEFYDKLIVDNPQKTFIIITNTPFHFSIPANAGTVICTYSVGPDSLKAVAKLLFGELEATGERVGVSESV